MAERENARPDFNPMHRIVGAIVVVAFAVIVLPMILSEREPPAELKGGAAVPPRSEIAETKVVVTPVAGGEVKSEPALEAETSAEKPATESKPEPETKTASAEKPAAPKKPEATPSREKPLKVAAAEKVMKGWAVQVGIFSNTENVHRLRDRLRSHGHAVHAETVTLDGRKAVRLRVGPFRDRAQAVQAQARIHKETGVQGAVQEYP